MTVLQLTEHGQLGWRPAHGFDFARGLGMQPLAIAEVGRVVDGVPVAFRQWQGRWQVVAVFGPTAELNLFVADDGRWRAPFVPAALRVYPFQLLGDDQALALWPQYQPESAFEAGVRPFFAADAMTPELQQIRVFLQAVAQGVLAAHEPLEMLAQQGLLQPWSPCSGEGDAGTPALPALYQLDDAALRGLPNADWLRLRELDALRWLYAHQDSLYHVRRFPVLAERSRRASAGAVPERPRGLAEDLEGFLGAMGDDLYGPES